MKLSTYPVIGGIGALTGQRPEKKKGLAYASSSDVFFEFIVIATGMI